MTTARSPSGSAASRSDRFGWATLVASGLLFVLGAGCGERDGRTLRVSHPNSANHPVHEGLLAMAERLDTLSSGRLELRVYPSQQLGTERASIELAQIGSIDLVKASAAALEAFAPEFAIFGVPYLFESEAHRWAVLDGDVGREILASAGERGLLGLAFMDGGSRSFYTVGDPVLTPDDLAGLKIRTQSSPSAIRFVETMGAIPAPLAFGELYSALQQGVVDGAENNPPSFYLTRHFEVAPHYCLNEHTAVPDVVLVSVATWESLTADQRAWIREAAEHGAAVQRALWSEAEAAALEAVVGGGATITRPDRSAFAEVAEPLRRSALEDPLLGPFLVRVRAAAEPDSEGDVP